MPLAVYILGLAIFAQGTSELVLAGLLPELAADLGVSVPDAGLLISAFAVGMLVGAPVLAVVTLRWPRRTALLTFLAVFVLAHAASALTSNYGMLLAGRVVAAFVYAGFWAVAGSTVVGLVPENVRGRAMSVLAGGLTVATVLGLSLGTVIGQQLGWRATFWTVAAMSALAGIGVLTTVPGGRPAAGTARVAAELRAMINPRLWLAYGTTALTTGALLASFSYLSAMLVDTTGLEPAWVPAVLALYGAGSLLGITIGGRNADARPFPLLYAGVAGLVLTSVALALTASVPPLVIPLVFLLGAFGFATNPALTTRVFALAQGAPTLAAALSVSSFNLGITVGPWLSGLFISAGLGYPSVAWTGAAIGLAALGSVALAATLHRRGSALSEPVRSPV
ncbi:Cmx/CmrA family chloramphenicol efflux MFS transporter [Nonomuraea jiangxiensis]|uniref:MFS transporter, DHA1 family, chloramphenicol resistance protein n=1 Tax=Nonomuraea jiangxiensis TaxID=633440 RepID=A0A1G8CCR5_9ACTN|nr:Cmx/CmrA family chloramphenicol efflux MFS transporter [Nonomuraea jiangxiensis]SDH42983.1 MFS transporter, DHA1 family, chloramphenicol resistance protein [Nonomuraea jiangxiensis]